MVLMGFYTCRENTECFISVKKKTMLLQILAILVRVAADHLNKKKCWGFLYPKSEKSI